MEIINESFDRFLAANSDGSSCNFRESSNHIVSKFEYYLNLSFFSPGPSTISRNTLLLLCDAAQ